MNTCRKPNTSQNGLATFDVQERLQLVAQWLYNAHMERTCAKPLQLLKVRKPFSELLTCFVDLECIKPLRPTAGICSELHRALRTPSPSPEDPKTCSRSVGAPLPHHTFGPHPSTLTSAIQFRRDPPKSSRPGPLVNPSQLGHTSRSAAGLLSVADSRPDPQRSLQPHKRPPNSAIMFQQKRRPASA